MESLLYLGAASAPPPHITVITSARVFFIRTVLSVRSLPMAFNGAAAECLSSRPSAGLPAVARARKSAYEQCAVQDVTETCWSGPVFVTGERRGLQSTTST